MLRAAAARLEVRAALLLAALVVLAVPFALLVVLVEARWEPLIDVDRGITAAAHDLVTDYPAVVTVMQAVSDLGSSVMWWVLHSVTALYLLVRRLLRLALFVVVTAAGGGLLNLAVKAAVARGRPDVTTPVSDASGFAFPSGHTMGSAIGVSVLLLVFLPALAPKWRQPAVVVGALFAFAVGLSRVVLGVHWASDVLGGWLLSLAWMLSMVAAFRTWQRQPLGATAGPASRAHPLGPAAHEPPSADPSRSVAPTRQPHQRENPK